MQYSGVTCFAVAAQHSLVLLASEPGRLDSTQSSTTIISSYRDGLCAVAAPLGFFEVIFKGEFFMGFFVDFFDDFLYGLFDSFLCVVYSFLAVGMPMALPVMGIGALLAPRAIHSSLLWTCP